MRIYFNYGSTRTLTLALTLLTLDEAHGKYIYKLGSSDSKSSSSGSAVIKFLVEVKASILHLLWLSKWTCEMGMTQLLLPCILKDSNLILIIHLECPSQNSNGQSTILLPSNFSLKFANVCFSGASKGPNNLGSLYSSIHVNNFIFTNLGNPSP